MSIFVCLANVEGLLILIRYQMVSSKVIIQGLIFMSITDNAVFFISETVLI